MKEKKNQYENTEACLSQEIKKLKIKKIIATFYLTILNFFSELWIYISQSVFFYFILAILWKILLELRDLNLQSWEEKSEFWDFKKLQ